MSGRSRRFRVPPNQLIKGETTGAHQEPGTRAYLTLMRAAALRVNAWRYTREITMALSRVPDLQEPTRSGRTMAELV